HPGFVCGALLVLTLLCGANGAFALVSTGVIDTMVGGENGDGWVAAVAKVSPKGMAVDAAGNLYISDTDNHRVRRVAAGSGIIETIAGTGAYGYNGDGILATQAKLAYPYSVAVDGSGNVYVADQINHRVRRIDGQTKIITTVVGNGTAGL